MLSFLALGPRNLACTLAFHEGFQVREVGPPEVAILAEPGIHRLERLGVELVEPVAPLAVFPHQARAAQPPQMLRDGRARDGKGGGDLPRRLAPVAQQVEYGAA